MGGALMMIEDMRWTLEGCRLLVWMDTGSYLDGAGCYFGGAGCIDTQVAGVCMANSCIRELNSDYLIYTYGDAREKPVGCSNRAL